MEDINMRQARLLRERTQQEVADALGVHVQTYRRLEEHPNEATIEQAKKIAAFLGFEMDDLFF